MLKRGISKAILLFFPIVYGCGKYTEKKEDNIALASTFTKLEPSAKLANVLDQFLKEVRCKDCLHQIYFDKVEPHNTIITLTSRSYNKDYLLENKPLFTLEYKNVTFYIYNGMEDYFMGDFKFREKGGEETNWPYAFWNVVDSSGTINIIKQGGHPFLPLQEIPPNIHLLK